MELWDAYDVNFQLLPDKTLVRGEEIPEGIYHLVCEVIVKHLDGSYLLMQRDVTKHYGGYWEATAGGSALKGETPIQCAIRELKEETGIYETSLVELGRVVNNEQNAIYVDYLVVTDCDKSSVTLQTAETQDYKWVDRDTLRRMSADELVTKRMQIFIEELR